MKEKYKVLIISMILIILSLVTYYAHCVLKTHIIFTHLFYIPIIIAVIWWRKKGILVSVAAAMILIFFNIFVEKRFNCFSDYVRSIMFIVVAVTANYFTQQLVKLQDHIKSRNDQLQNTLEETEIQLRESRIALAQKNLDLQNIIEQIDEEKERIKKNICDNVTKIILPAVKKFELSGVDNKIIEMFEGNLKGITSSFGAKLNPSMTSREIEISNMIKSGMSSKEIAEILHISPGTVEIYRNNIRRKLGIVNKNINLATFLNTEN